MIDYNARRINMIVVLANARRLIEENEWGRLAAAMDEEGNPVKPDSPRACKFCLLGAIQRVTVDLKDTICYQDEANTISELHHVLGMEYDQSTRGVPSITHFNDNVAKSEADIFQLIDRTTERLITELD